MNKDLQTISVFFETPHEYNATCKNFKEYHVKDVNIKSMKTNDYFIEIKYVDKHQKEFNIVIPKLDGVKVMIE